MYVNLVLYTFCLMLHLLNQGIYIRKVIKTNVRIRMEGVNQLFARNFFLFLSKYLRIRAFEVNLFDN